MKYFSFIVILMGLALTSCGPKNDQNQNQNQNYGNYTPNDYCLRAGGNDPSCQGWGQQGNPYFRNYPNQNGSYNNGTNCGSGWAPVYGQNTGLGCYNQTQYPGNTYQWNWQGSGYATGGITTAVSCQPYANSYAPQCPNGSYCRPIDQYNGICARESSG